MNGNGGRMHVRLNGEPLEEVDCFKHLGSQMAGDGGGERDLVTQIEKWYREWGALRSVLNNLELGINATKCLYVRVIVQFSIVRSRGRGMRSLREGK